MQNKQVTGKIVKISGPLVIAEGMHEANMFDVVQVGEKKLIGEIIEIHGDLASVQVYEETAGLGRGDIVVSTGAPLSVELGPGMVTNIYDGIQRPLEDLYRISGANIQRGVTCPSLDRSAKWHFIPKSVVGDSVASGDIIGIVNETELVEHRIMIPPKTEGKLEFIAEEGDYTVEEKIAEIAKPDGTRVPLTLMQKWPVRVARPYREKLPPNIPLITGQRNIDTMFPIAKGGTACIPGPFGSGKTVDRKSVV